MEELQPQPESQKNFQKVELTGINKHPLNAEISVGNPLGEGESFQAREATLRFTREDIVREYPVVIKTYINQDVNTEITEAYNRAYEQQLVYYESLRRAGVNVIPTFRLAKDGSGNTLGLVMTNLGLKSLTASEVDRVTTSKDDTRGNFLAKLTQAEDKRKADKIGLKLAHDSWMHQYSDKWAGLGKFIPKAVVADIIGIEITDRDRFKKFLAEEKNSDLAAEADRTYLLI